MKKLSLFLLFAYFGLGNAFSQSILEFKDLTGMSSGRGAITSVSAGTCFYVSNGFTSENYSGNVEKYDVATNTWSVLTTKLSPKLFASSAIVADKLYVFNGDLFDQKLNKKMEVVDLKTGEVTYATDNPQPAHAAGVAVWNDIIYSFGGKIDGAQPTYSNRLYCFDVSSNRWIKLASMPEAKEAKGVAVEGKLYVIGGYSGKVSKRIDMYDTETNTWTQLADLPVAISANSVTAHGSKIYTLFDYTNQTYIGCYDIPSNQFSVVKSKKMIARRHAGAHIINDMLYIVGGNTDSTAKSSLSSLQVADLK